MPAPGPDSPYPDPVDPAGEVSDAELLRRHVAGDADAFGRLVARHRDRLWAVALRTLGDPEEAADAVQDALVSALRSAGRFRGDAAVTTWLHRIVVNACLDRLRRQRRRRVVPLQEAVHDRTAPDPADRQQVRLDVAQALTRLPAEQRVAVVLVDLEGWSVNDAAALLSVPTGTVKSRCARGRARLAELLGFLRAGGNAAPADGVQPVTYDRKGVAPDGC